jgi:hypothetical protein
MRLNCATSSCAGKLLGQEIRGGGGAWKPYSYKDCECCGDARQGSETKSEQEVLEEIWLVVVAT